MAKLLFFARSPYICAEVHILHMNAEAANSACASTEGKRDHREQMAEVLIDHKQMQCTSRLKTKDRG